MAKLSIIVPHYKESWDTCHYLFDSLAIQEGIKFDDFEVLLVEDGREGVLYDVNFKKYPYEVKQFIKKNEGVSAARQYGLEKAKSDYVMFCDCDDMFLSVYGIYLILQRAGEDFDVISSSFIEEQYTDEGEFRIIRHDKDVTFVHGKAYKRSYLKDNDIHWDKDLTVHEDGFFNTIAFTISDNRTDITTPIYVWKWNPNSVVRKDNDWLFTLHTYADVLKTRVYICRELFSRGEIDNYVNAVCKTVLDCYYDFQRPDWMKEENKEAVEKAKREFAKFYAEFGTDWKEANIDRIAEMSYICRNLAFSSGFRIESQSMREFLNEITKKYTDRK